MSEIYLIHNTKPHFHDWVLYGYYFSYEDAKKRMDDLDEVWGWENCKIVSCRGSIDTEKTSFTVLILDDNSEETIYIAFNNEDDAELEMKEILEEDGASYDYFIPMEEVFKDDGRLECESGCRHWCYECDDKYCDEHPCDTCGKCAVEYLSFKDY